MTAEEKKQYFRDYYLKNKDKFKKRNVDTHKRRGYMANFHLKRKYGINEEEYGRLLSLQCGCCAICGKSMSDYKRKLAVDHDHSSGKVRGLLCVKCNGGIGCFEENPLLFDKAKEYLHKHQLL